MMVVNDMHTEKEYTYKYTGQEFFFFYCTLDLHEAFIWYISKCFKIVLL